MYLHNLSAAAIVSGNVVADDNRASYSVYGAGAASTWTDVGPQSQTTGLGQHSRVEYLGWGGGVYINGGGGLLQGNTITGNLALLAR